MVLVLMPSIRHNPQKRELLNSVGIKFRTVGWVALILLLLTGLYNMHVRGVAFAQLTNSSYNMLFAVKLVLFIMVLLISAWHDFYIGPKSIKLMQENNDAKVTQRYVKTARFVGKLNLLLALVAVALGVLIVRGW